jgi:hypothetical protein
MPYIDFIQTDSGASSLPTFIRTAAPVQNTSGQSQVNLQRLIKYSLTSLHSKGEE